MNKTDKLELKGVMSEGYGIIPKKIMKDKELTIEAKSIYAFIASYSGNGNSAYPTVEYITDFLGISRQRFNKHRKLLEDKGYISVSQERQQGSQFNHNVYTIEFIPTLRFATTENPTTENPTTENITTNNNTSINNTINNNSSHNNTHSENAIESDFEEWWNLYDKKLDKKKSFTVFKKCHKEHGYEKILEGTKAYLQTVTDKQYQRYPTTFLNNQSYLDIDEFKNIAKQKMSKLRGNDGIDLNSQYEKDLTEHLGF